MTKNASRLKVKYIHIVYMIMHCIMIVAYVDYVLRDDFILDLRGIDYAGIGNRTP